MKNSLQYIQYTIVGGLGTQVLILGVRIEVLQVRKIVPDFIYDMWEGMLLCFHIIRAGVKSSTMHQVDWVPKYFTQVARNLACHYQPRIGPMLISLMLDYYFIF